MHSDELSRRTQFRRRFLFVRATKLTWLRKRREFRPYTKYFHIPFATSCRPPSASHPSLLFLSLLASPPIAPISSLSHYGRYQRVLGFIRRNENFALSSSSSSSLSCLFLLLLIFPQREEEKQFKFRSFIKRNISLSFFLSLLSSLFSSPWAPPRPLPSHFTLKLSFASRLLLFPCYFPYRFFLLPFVILERGFWYFCEEWKPANKRCKNASRATCLPWSTSNRWIIIAIWAVVVNAKTDTSLENKHKQKYKRVLIMRKICSHIYSILKIWTSL